MKRIIHINQHVIKANRKNEVENPVITCKTYKETVYGSEVRTKACEIVYKPQDPLSCGAHVWIETHDPVEILTLEGWVTL
jgi:hypothetical protein